MNVNHIFAWFKLVCDGPTEIPRDGADGVSNAGDAGGPPWAKILWNWSIQFIDINLFPMSNRVSERASDPTSAARVLRICLI